MTTPAKTRKSPLERYNAARANLLLVVVLTAVNLVLLVLNSDMQFLFSASFPSLAYMIGDALSAETGIALFRVGALLLGAGCIGLYLLCWLCSKKLRGFMIAALVLFGMDCLAFLGMLALVEWDVSMIIDAAFHAWVLWALISGVVAMAQLHGQPQEAAVPAQEPPQQP